MTEEEKAELKRRIEVMQAFLDGKKIQGCAVGKSSNGWHDIPKPVWDWHFFDYRVAPEKLTVYIYRFEGTGDLFSSSVQPGHAGHPLVKIIEVEV